MSEITKEERTLLMSEVMRVVILNAVSKEKTQ